MRTFVIVGFIITFGCVILFSSNKNEKKVAVISERAPASNPPVNTQPQQQKQEALAEISKVVDCYQSNACNYPQTDPRSYEFAVSRDLAEKLKFFHEKFRQDPAAQEDLTRLARQAFKIEDGFVQSVALDIFKDLPINKENLNVLGEGLKVTPDPLIAEKSLSELQRYINTPEEGQMQGIVQNVLGNGAHFASQKVGENILSFINERSFPSYRDLQRQLPAQSRVSRDLAGALREYHRQRTGG